MQFGQHTLHIPSPRSVLWIGHSSVTNKYGILTKQYATFILQDNRMSAITIYIFMFFTFQPIKYFYILSLLTKKQGIIRKTNYIL